jgi:outer membrane protein assembly factor BamB
MKVKKIIQLILLNLIVISVHAQKYELIFSQKIDVDFKDYFLGEGEKQFYLTNSGEYLVANNVNRYFIFHPESKTLIKEGEHSPKINKAVSLIQSNANMGGLFVQFDEGVAFYVLEEEDLIIFFDWSAGRNEIKAEKISTGEQVWITDDFKYTSSFSQQLFGSAFGLGGSVAEEANYTRPQFEDDKMRTFGQNHYLSSSSTQVARHLMRYLSPTKQILLVDTDGLAAIDIETGQQQWRYENQSLKMGEIHYVEDSNDIIYINQKNRFAPRSDAEIILASSGKNDDKTIVRIDTESGEIRWETEFWGDFQYDKSHVIDDRLVLDFSLIESFNLETGEKIFSSMAESDAKIEKLVEKAKHEVNMLMQMEAPAVFESDQVLYTTNFLTKSVGFGVPEPELVKYNFQTGEEIWRSQPIAKKSQLYYQNNKHVILERSKGIAKTSLIGVDKESGKQEFETDFIQNYWFRNGAGTVFTQDAIYRSGKKSTLVYDSHSFKLLKEFDTKSSNIGKLQAMFPVNNKIAYIGDKGLAYFNKEGNIDTELEAKNIQAAFWNSDVSIIFDRKEILIVNNKAEEIVQRFEFTYDEENLYFLTEDASKLAIINPTNKTILLYSDKEIAGKM